MSDLHHDMDDLGQRQSVGVELGVGQWAVIEHEVGDGHGVELPRT